MLVGLANHAGPDGTGAFPSVATLVRYTGLSERTVRTCLDRLEGDGIISPCDPDIVPARFKRADRRPKGWDLNLGLVRADLAEDEAPAQESQFRGTAARLATAGSPGAGAVQTPHPVPATGEAVDNVPDEVQQLHPAVEAGCNERANGMQLVRSRSAVVAPEPSRKPYMEPPAVPAHEASFVVGSAGGGSAGEFFAALGDVWRLTAAQRARLAPVVTVALDAGWTPRGLAAFTGANTDGVRNPYAVLAARLSPAELPAPSARSGRPPWCGECDERTRMLGFDGDAPRPCPHCRPPVAACRLAPSDGPACSLPRGPGNSAGFATL